MEQAEHRHSRRNRTLRAGRIIFNSGYSSLNCSVRNISEGGALLQVPGMVGIPREFELSIDGDTARPCRVAWRKEDRMGVEFIAALSDPDAGPQLLAMSVAAAGADTVDTLEVPVEVEAEPQTRPKAAERSKRPLSGLWPPVCTPFKDDGSVDFRRLVRHSKQLLADGAHGLAVLGTTSEANSLSLDERRQVIDAHIEAGIEASQLLPGTGACAIDDAATLARHAGEIGAAAVLLLPPFYYKNVSDDGLYAFVARVIERSGPVVPRILLYHIPPVAAVGWSNDLVRRLIAAFPGIVVGMKDSSGDFEHTKSVIDTFPGFVVFPGAETMLARAMAAGAAGCISATANINARGIRAVFDRWMERDAPHLQNDANAVRTALERNAMVPGLKAVLSSRYGDPSWSNVRPPLVALSPGARATLFGEPSVAPLLETLPRWS
ncbi:MAG: dihydrodipicolinate synthase family protein [Bauldia sp.]